MNETPILEFSNDDENMQTDVAATFVKSSSSRSRRSINLLLESLKVTQGNNEDSLQTYHERLKKEVKDWQKIFTANYKVLNEKAPIISLEALSETNRAYLDAAPQLQLFHNQSMVFRKKAKLFLETEYLPMQEKVMRALEISEYMLDNSKEQLLNERTADVVDFFI